MKLAALYFFMAAITSSGLPNRKTSPLEYAQHPRKRLASIFAILGLGFAIFDNH